MRGKAWKTVANCERVGITPAHAGKSAYLASGYYIDWDHPRTCGEKDADALSTAFLTGSPPHMRGKEAWLGENPVQFGITPAHAGKSLEGARWPS